MTRSEILLVSSSAFIALGGTFVAAVIPGLYPDYESGIFWGGIALIVLGFLGIAGVFLRSYFRDDGIVVEQVASPRSTTFIDAEDVGSIASFGDASSATNFARVRRGDSLTTFGASHSPREK